MTPYLKKIEDVAKEASQKASSILLRYHNQRSFKIDFKGDVNLVTSADIESEAMVIQTIRHYFPEHAILSEENKNSHGTSMEGPIWIIDPLDGTTNFSHGVPFFSISIAYRENNQTKIGLIYQPVLNELFIAHLGGGSTLNGKKISVSNSQTLSKSLLATGFPYDRRNSQRNNLSEFCSFEISSQDVRRPGAATLDLAYVSCGRFDGFWEPGLSAWDIAAGMLLVTEAGGTATDYSGNEIVDLWNGEMVASNGLIHQSMVRQLQKSQSNLLIAKNFI